MRIVIDTNIFVGSAWDASSASRRIVDACHAGRFELVVSPAVKREYARILPRAIRKRASLESILPLIEGAVVVEPESVPRVVAADPADDKFFATALAGGAEVLISNDQQVLDSRPEKGKLDVLRPGPFVREYFS